MKALKEWYVNKMIERTVKALKANFFDAKFFKDRESLFDSLMSYVKPKMRIGFGGSVAVRELGIVERLSKEDVILLDHWKEGLAKEDIAGIMIQQLTSDLFIASANAITERGEIVNTDGTGNRVGAMILGPKKVIIVAGYNKIVPDLDAAMDRIKRYAAPMNAKRLNLSLPCVEKGYCLDCKSASRICNVTTIMHKKSWLADISVFLINEELGL